MLLIHSLSESGQFFRERRLENRYNIDVIALAIAAAFLLFSRLEKV